MQSIKRGEVYYANLGNGIGAEQRGKRPVLVVQNNIVNHFSKTTIICPLTHSTKKESLPTHVAIKSGTILAEQIRTISKNRLKKVVDKSLNA